MEPTFESIERLVLTPSCALAPSCHAGGVPRAGLDLSPARAHGQLVNRASSARSSELLVVPGQPAASYLLKKLEGPVGAIDGDLMPSAGQRLPAETIDAIRQWILAGAPPPTP